MWIILWMAVRTVGGRYVNISRQFGIASNLSDFFDHARAVINRGQVFSSVCAGITASHVILRVIHKA